MELNRGIRSNRNEKWNVRKKKRLECENECKYKREREREKTGK